jgi:hypothetical protein
MLLLLPLLLAQPLAPSATVPPLRSPAAADAAALLPATLVVEHGSASHQGGIESFRRATHSLTLIGREKQVGGSRGSGHLNP